MKKQNLILVYLLSGGIFLNSGIAFSAVSEQQKQDILNTFGNKNTHQIKLFEKENSVELVFPELSIKHTDESEDKIASYSLSLEENGQFKNLPQYKYSTNSVLRLKSLAYSFWPVAIAEADTFSEEASVVPSLGYASEKKLQINNFRFMEKENGQTTEWLRIGSFFSDIKSTESADGINITTTLKGKDIKLTSAMVSVSVPAYVTKTVMENAIFQPGVPTPIIADNIISVFKTGNITVDVPMLSTVIDFKLDSKGKMTADKEKNTIDFVSDFIINDLKIKTMFPINATPQSINFKIVGKELNKSAFEKIANLQQQSIKIEDESKEASEKMSQEMKQAFQEMLIGKDIRYKFEIVFINGTISGVGKLDIKKDDIDYITKITITNFDKISPDTQKICAEQRGKTPKIPEECLKMGVLEILRPYLDMSKRSVNDKGETVDVLTVQQTNAGKYINGKRIDSPSASGVSGLSM